MGIACPGERKVLDSIIPKGGRALVILSVQSSSLS